MKKEILSIKKIFIVGLLFFTLLFPSLGAAAFDRAGLKLMSGSGQGPDDGRVPVVGR